MSQDIYFISNLVCTLIYSHLAINSNFMNKKHRINDAFHRYTSLLCFMSTVNIFFHFAKNDSLRKIMLLMMTISWLLLSFLFLNLSISLQSDKGKTNKSKRWSYATLVIISILIFIHILLGSLTLWTKTQFNLLLLVYFIIINTSGYFILRESFHKNKYNILERTYFSNILRTYITSAFIVGFIQLIFFNNLYYKILIMNLDYCVSSLIMFFYLKKYKGEDIYSVMSKEYLMNKVKDIIILTDNNGNILDINKQALNIGKYKKEQLVNSKVKYLFSKDFKEPSKVQKKDNTSYSDKKDNICFITKEGEMIPVEIDISPIKNSFDESLGNVIVAQDMRVVKMLQQEALENKRSRDRLYYLSYHDSLTGLYNRGYFEDYMVNFDREKYPLCGFIICDMDNLKLVNDTLGHQEGDEIIIQCAKAINESIISEGIVARIGGDEFAVLIQCVNREEFDSNYYNIKTSIDKYNESMPKIPISMSIGTACGDRSFLPIDLFKEADDNMYRNKLKQSYETKKVMVNSIKRALISRDYVDGGHVDRIKFICEEMGRQMNLSRQQIKNLRLLSKYHDIGKVGVPESILYKPDKLSYNELVEVRRHCEIGYRISKTTPKLQVISELILKHHERWDGNGYPLGLKREEIPIECRIMAVADAYDVMTSGRPYKVAKSHEEALKEILDESGKQFDPSVVDVFKNIFCEKLFIEKEHSIICS